MPKYKKQFDRPTYVDHKILNSDGTAFGIVRIKPVSILWKGANRRGKFKAVSIEDFASWIAEHGTESKS